MICGRCCLLPETGCRMIIGEVSSSRVRASKRRQLPTLGEGIIIRSSRGNCFSTPPLKKNVTWAYFSVSIKISYQHSTQSHGCSQNVDGETLHRDVHCNLYFVVFADAFSDRLTSDVTLLNTFRTQPLGENIGHSLRRESNIEGELGVVSRHGGDALGNVSNMHRLVSKEKYSKDTSKIR